MSICWRAGSGATNIPQPAQLPSLHSSCLVLQQQRICVAKLSPSTSFYPLSAAQACVCFLSELPNCVRPPAAHKHGASATDMGGLLDGASIRADPELQGAYRERRSLAFCAISFSVSENFEEAAKEMEGDVAGEEELWRECIGGDEVEIVDNPLNESTGKGENSFKIMPKPKGASFRDSRQQTDQSDSSSLYKGWQPDQIQNEKFYQDVLKGSSRKINSQESQAAIEKVQPTSFQGSKSSEISGSNFEANSGASNVGNDPEAPRLIVNLDLKLYKAKRFRQYGEPDKAEQLLKQCIKIWPDDGRAYVKLGKVLVKGRRFEEARKVFEEGCRVCQGENANIWQAWALLELQTGNVAQGRRLFDAAIAADKRHAPSWHAWAMLELRHGRAKKAKSLIQKGLKFCGPNEYFYQTLACIAVKQKQYDQARSLFIKATQFNPKSAASWMAWGLLEMEHGVAETARQLFQRGIRASPKNRYIFQAWARFEAKQGNVDRARELFKRGVVLNPQDPVMLQSFALFEYSCSNTLNARELFIRASKVDPMHQPVWLAWGWMEWKEKNLDTARKLFQKSISVNNTNMNSVRAFQLWGVLEGGDGNPGKARALFKCALNIDSQNFRTWTAWVILEEQQGNSVRAEELRNLYFQQSTEVVNEAPWENFAEMFVPAIDGIKKLLKLDSTSSPPNDGYSNMGTVEPRKTEVNSHWQSV